MKTLRTKLPIPKAPPAPASKKVLPARPKAPPTENQTVDETTIDRVRGLDSMTMPQKAIDIISSWRGFVKDHDKLQAQWLNSSAKACMFLLCHRLTEKTFGVDKGWSRLSDKTVNQQSIAARILRPDKPKLKAIQMSREWLSNQIGVSRARGVRILQEMASLGIVEVSKLDPKHNRRLVRFSEDIIGAPVELQLDEIQDQVVAHFNKVCVKSEKRVLNRNYDGQIVPIDFDPKNRNFFGDTDNARMVYEIMVDRFKGNNRPAPCTVTSFGGRTSSIYTYAITSEMRKKLGVKRGDCVESMVSIDLCNALPALLSDFIESRLDKWMESDFIPLKIAAEIAKRADRTKLFKAACSAGFYETASGANLPRYFVKKHTMRLILGSHVMARRNARLRIWQKEYDAGIGEDPMYIHERWLRMVEWFGNLYRPIERILEEIRPLFGSKGLAHILTEIETKIIRKGLIPKLKAKKLEGLQFFDMHDGIQISREHAEIASEILCAELDRLGSCLAFKITDLSTGKYEYKRRVKLLDWHLYEIKKYGAMVIEPRLSQPRFIRMNEADDNVDYWIEDASDDMVDKYTETDLMFIDLVRSVSMRPNMETYEHKDDEDEIDDDPPLIQDKRTVMKRQDLEQTAEDDAISERINRRLLMNVHREHAMLSFDPFNAVRSMKNAS